MMIPSYIKLLALTILLALGCGEVGDAVAFYFDGSTASSLVIFFVLFLPAQQVLFEWHRAVWDRQNAA